MIFWAIRFGVDSITLELRLAINFRTGFYLTWSVRDDHAEAKEAEEEAAKFYGRIERTSLLDLDERYRRAG
jgi:hypothetical protein